MTYCLAIAINEGLVFSSDSRTNAGADQVRTYSKMRTFGVPGDRQLVLLSAGNLATC
jgi:putative proteasome-type protease